MNIRIALLTTALAIAPVAAFASNNLTSSDPAAGINATSVANTSEVTASMANHTAAGIHNTPAYGTYGQTMSNGSKTAPMKTSGKTTHHMHGKTAAAPAAKPAAAGTTKTHHHVHHTHTKKTTTGAGTTSTTTKTDTKTDSKTSY